MVIRKGYLLTAFFVFLMETVIFFGFAHHGFIRGFVGDFLVVIFLYTLMRSVVDLGAKFLAAGVLCFAFVIEILQYFKFVYWLGLEQNRLALIVFGTHFDPCDLLAYTAGCLTVYLVDEAVRRKKGSL
ncbi:DUF2809 domain-containing protein [Desulfobotulus sp. H1]|uniref:DUF2809 domain-containing protein n=1 Tax=Desulfobotulus pelophilus TaxID=2823377 RepID=A0ABT3N7M4_9BACT|nr:DUF2809 domain-containing protein [Desulfobotulus pelophilus]MCW7753456.1 DUF2809 domain-containing protein [Desulfobotulus pelophilus]